MDCVFIFTFLHYILYGKNLDFLVNLGLFYAFRGLFVQRISILQYYDTYLFDFPGFYSFAVPLFPSPDFFFSGHIGACLLCGIYFKNTKQNILFIFSLYVMIFEGLFLVVTRAHYSIDILFGFIVAHYIYLLDVRMFRNKFCMKMLNIKDNDNNYDISMVECSISLNSSNKVLRKVDKENNKINTNQV